MKAEVELSDDEYYQPMATYSTKFTVYNSPEMDKLMKDIKSNHEKSDQHIIHNLNKKKAARDDILAARARAASIS